MSPKKERLDVLLVQAGLAPTRARAQALILGGQVVVGEARVDKPGTRVAVDAPLRLKGEVLPYVSRGGLKLRHALVHFGFLNRRETLLELQLRLFQLIGRYLVRVELLLQHLLFIRNLIGLPLLVIGFGKIGQLL